MNSQNLSIVEPSQNIQLARTIGQVRSKNKIITIQDKATLYSVNHLRQIHKFNSLRETCESSDPNIISQKSCTRKLYDPCLEIKRRYIILIP